MSGRRSQFLFALIVTTTGCGAAGCLSRAVEPHTELLPKGELRMDWSDWGAVLGQACAGDRVDYGRILQDQRPLHRFLARVARVGPRSTPNEFSDDKSRTAYWINCYNAAILESVTQLLSNTWVSAWDVDRLDHLYAYRIDGKLRTPAEIRREALTAGHDDWRIRFALCDGCRVGPPLFRRVFLPELLDGQLNDAVRGALAGSGVATISHGERKQLLVWEGIYSDQARWVNDYERRFAASDATLLNALLAWCERERREELNSAVGYEVARMPDDHQLNCIDPPQAPEERSAFSKLSSFSLIRGAK